VLLAIVVYFPRSPISTKRTITKTNHRLLQPYQ
jgi:hypothetical protein